MGSVALMMKMLLVPLPPLPLVVVPVEALLGLPPTTGVVGVWA